MPKIPAVLLVDDDPVTNFLNKKLLLRLGITDNIRVALNGKEALQQVQQQCRELPAGCRGAAGHRGGGAHHFRYPPRPEVKPKYVRREGYGHFSTVRWLGAISGGWELASR